MAIIENEELIGGDLVEDETQEVSQPEVKNEAPAVPDKYRGKSLEDIVRMHQEAEKLIGKQAQEVGEVRKLADELLKQQLSKNQELSNEPEETEVDFFEDPKKAVSKAVDKHPDVIAAKEAARQMKAMQAQQTLVQKHPDMAQVVGSPEFAEWVKASKVRLKLYQEADANFDTDAADELLSTFKELRSVRTSAAQSQATEEARAGRDKALSAATVDTSGTGEAPRKVYRRTDLIRLKMNDPDRYEALQPEIMKAYAEGRVK